MKIKTINLKSNLNRRNLRDHTYKFFQQTKFNSNYIMIITKASINDGSSIINLGRKLLLNLKNQEEINTYRTLVINSFLNQEDNIKLNSKDQILINYIETDKEYYDNYIKQISNSNNLDLDSGNELSLAISINCLSGTFKKQNSNLFSILLVVESK